MHNARANAWVAAAESPGWPFAWATHTKERPGSSFYQVIGDFKRDCVHFDCLHMETFTGPCSAILHCAITSISSCRQEHEFTPFYWLFLCT
jgi:hypothetical protein